MASENNDGIFDSLLTALKWNGKYQVIQMILVMSCSLPVAFNVMSIVFIGYHADSHCADMNNTLLQDRTDNRLDLEYNNMTYGTCDVTIHSNISVDHDVHVACLNGFEYREARDRSLNSDFDLVCGRESLSDLLQTLYTVGNGIGALVFTRLSDRKGRRIAHCLAGVCFLVTSVVVSFMPSYPSLAVVKVIQGATQMGLSLTGTTILLETVPSAYRALMGMFGTLVWALCVVLYAATAYAMRFLSWRYHQLIVGLSLVFYLGMPWILDETLRWLGAKRRFEEVEGNLKKAARINGKNSEDIVKMFRGKLESLNYPDLQDISKTGKEENPLILTFTDRRLLVLSLTVWFMWLADSLAYYGLSLTSTEFHSDKYIGFGLSAIMEVLSAPAFWLTVDRFGRRRTTFGYHLLGGVALILSVVFQSYQDEVPSFTTAVTVLTLVGKFAISTSFSILWVYTPELYPTPIRNFSFGLASVAARIGGIFAPFSRTLHRHHPWLLGSVFGSLCLVVCVLVRFLPETGGQELPQTMGDMRHLLEVKTLVRGEKNVGTKWEKNVGSSGEKNVGTGAERNVDKNVESSQEKNVKEIEETCVEGNGPIEKHV